MNPHKELLQLLFNQDYSLNRIYGAMSKDLASVLRRYKVNSNSKLWFKNTRVEKEVEAILLRYQGIIFDHISKSVTDGWQMSNKHNDGLVNTYIKGIAIDDELQKYFLSNTGALTAFLSRGKKGFKLSDRVWNLTRQTKKQLEYFIAEGLTEGRPAVKLATDLKRYLKHPDKRFRRIRDPKTGKLKLSAPAEDFHPGRGVYRSSYRNALRLALNEVNIAYRTADHIRRQQLPFVTGVQVNLSPAHPVYDICDELQGQYPKSFVFTGWHPNCLCFATSKLLAKQDFINYLNGKGIPPSKQVSALPNRATQYLNKNFEKINDLKSKPYFITDNFKVSKDKYVLKKSLIEPK